jgi:chemotaxis protein CheC
MTSSSSGMLSELELDALTEIVNLGVGNAAVGLREMVQEEVLLSVPNVAIVTREQAISNLGQSAVKRLVAVHQNFDGDIRGRAMLIFPEAQSMELVRAVVGSDLSLDDLIELEQEALAETGNILLNGCLGTMANSFGRTLHISLPEVVHGDGSDFFDLTPWPRVDDSVLFIYINFAVRRGNIQGYLAMLLDLPSLVTLKDLLSGYITRMGGTTVVAPNNAG